MGKTFYLIKPAQNKAAIIKAIEEDRYADAKELIDENVDLEVSIGSLTSGWSFTFNFPWYVFDTQEELINYLKSGQIVNSDSTNVSFEEFWALVQKTMTPLKYDIFHKLHLGVVFRT